MSKRPDKGHYVPPARRKQSPAQPFITSPPPAATTPITTTTTTTTTTTNNTTNNNIITTATTDTNTATAHANSPAASHSARLVSLPQHARFEPSATPPLRSSAVDAAMRPQHSTPHSRHTAQHRDSYELAAAPFLREVCPVPRCLLSCCPAVLLPYCSLHPTSRASNDGTRGLTTPGPRTQRV